MWSEQKARKVRDMLLDINNKGVVPCNCIDCLLQNRQMAGMIGMLNWMLNADPASDRLEEEVAKLAGKARAGEKVSFQMEVV